MKKVLIFCLLVSSMVWALSAQAAYISTNWGGLYQYDIKQGTTTYIGKTSTGRMPQELTDIAMSSGKLYGVDTSALYSVDVNNGQLSVIRRLGYLQLNALVGDPNGSDLYTASDSGQFGRLSDTGQYSLIGNLGSYKGQTLRSSGDLVFGPDGTLYATVYKNKSGEDYLATIDVKTGQATVLGEVRDKSVYGLVFLDGKLYGTTADHDLIEIDQNTGRGTYVGRIMGLELGAITGATGDPSDTTASGATPEPATLLLLSSAMGMVLWRRRRGAVG